MRHELALVAIICIFTISCTKDETPKPPGKHQAPEIVSFEASATRITSGETVRISWQTRDAEAVELKANGRVVELGDADPAADSVEIPVHETTEFRLAAIAGERRAEAEPITVEVEKPRIVSFTATPETIEEGEAVTLSWKTEYATALELRDAAGDPIDLGDASVAEGSVQVVPTSSTTYTLRAIAGGHSTEAKTSVRIRGAPVLEVSADPSVILYGESVTFRWTMAEAETLRIERDGTLIHEATEASGEFVDEPLLTSTYVFTASRGEKTAVQSVAVDVRPVIFSFTSSQTPTPVGDGVEVRWHVGGAREIVIANGAGYEETLEVEPISEGSLVLPMGPEGRFTLFARSDSHEETASAQTPVLPPPTIGAFTVVPEVVSADPGQTARVTLSWSGVEGATSLLLEGDRTGPIDISGQPTANGSVEVEVSEDTTFVLTAQNAAGEANATASVRVVPFPAIVELAAVPGRVGVGEAFVLSWATVNATSISLTADGLSVPGVAEDDFAASVELQIAADTTYVLRAENDAGDWVEETLTVTVGAPQILSFTATPDYAPTGGTVTFAWENLGGVSLILTDPSGAIVCSTTDLAEIEAGDCPSSIVEEGTFAFTLVVTNGAGDESTATVTVTTSTGPRILAFSGSKNVLTEGESITFSWQVQDDPFGETPVLSLSDGITSYDLSDADPNQGSKSFTIHDVGDLTFTFTASTAAGTKSATHEARVYAQPSVTLLATPSQYDGTTPITLSWTSENADASLVLYSLDGDGRPVQPPLYEVPEPERASGSFEVEPATSTTYRIVATNGAGATATAEASVTLAPPTILSFEAVPDEVVEGDEVTLSWNTILATAVQLSVAEGFVAEEIFEPFVDIRTQGATALTMTNACGGGTFQAIDEGCAQITFPTGFTFPFGGTNLTSIYMAANGFLSVAPFSNTTWNNQNLDGTNTHVAIAPLWEDFETGQFYYLFGQDDRGEYLVTQWTEMVYYDQPQTSATFQAVLRANGSIEFRYGPMSGAPQGQLDGDSATIGIQYPDGSLVYVFHFGASGYTSGTPYPGGLSGRAWRFAKPDFAPNDSFLFHPAEDVDVVLTAIGPGGETEATVSITVHPRARLTVIGPTEEIEAGDVFTIGWTTEDANSLVIVDDDGNTVCEAPPQEVAAGSCEISEAVPGTYTYTVRATGALGHVVEEVLTLDVYALLAAEFQVSAAEIDYGQGVTLSWETTGASEISLTANGEDLLSGNEPLDQGSITHVPTEETTYVFTATSADGRTRSISHTVTVRTFHFELSADSTQVKPGTPVTISWSVTSLTGESPLIYAVWPLEEVTDGSAAFEDISQDGMPPTIAGGADGTLAEVQFPAGFTFPYFGETYSALKVSADGFVTFNLGFNDTTQHANYPLPSTARPNQHLAIFWDDLHTSNGGVYTAFRSNPDRFIVQWSHVARYAPSPPSGQPRTYDMNFQIVLFPDGKFEYRYGTMTPPSTPATSPSDCTPLTCENETNGSSATIGYQVPGQDKGFMLHFGGPAAEGDPPFPGGLANRSFRYQTPPSHSIVVTPSDDTEYEVCVALGGKTECKSLVVQAPWEILSFAASSDWIYPGDAVTLSWETVGADDLELTANGQPVHLAGKDLEHDALVLSPTETTTYELTLVSLGRAKTASLTVEVRQLDVEVTVPEGPFVAGQSVDVEFDYTVHAPGNVVIYGPMHEVPSTFTDIRNDPNAVLLIGAGSDVTVVDHAFAGGFAFPYFGTTHTSVRVSTDGYLSFDTSTTTASINTRFPNSDSLSRQVHLAAFWDDLDTRSSGRVHALLASDGSYVFQWSNVSKWHGSSNTNEYDLNFQIVLFPDGAFEFRYGTMDPPPGHSSTCKPTIDCVADANGSSATIGYQDPTGTMGNNLHFGGESQDSSNVPFRGGLANRSFRMEPKTAPGSIPMTLGAEEGEYEYMICGVVNGYARCEAFALELLPPSFVMVTEILLAPASGEAQWFEVRNLTRESIDLQGWEIHVGPSVHTIAQPLVIPPFGFATFSFGPAAGFAADYVIPGLGLSSASGSLKIAKSGVAISGLSWDAAWPIVSGQSLELDSLAQWSGHHHLLSSPALFCARTESYDGGSNAGTPGWDGGSCDTSSGYVVYNHTDAEIFDIQATGTHLFSGIFNEVGVNLSFSFPFFGTASTQIWVTSSGFLTVTQADDEYVNRPLPSIAPPASAGIIAPFWDDLFYSATGGVVKWEERTVGGQKVAIFDWHNVNHSDVGAPISFQAQLWEDGRIVFAYRQLGGSPIDRATRGGSATVGIQAPGTSNPAYVLYSHGQPSLTEGQVIEFVPITP